MPLPELPGWALTASGVVSGGLLTELIRALKARGQAQSTERLTLQQSEAEFRGELIRENRDQRARLEALERKVDALETQEAACRKRNEELEEKVETLEAANAALKEDLDALSARISERGKKLVAESLQLPMRSAR